MCGSHYARWRRGLRGNALEAPFRIVSYLGATCRVEGCSRPCKMRELCEGHYHRLHNLGWSEERLTEPFQRRHPGEWRDWTLDGSGYVVRLRTKDGVTERQAQHRLVMSEMIGRELMDHEEVHHKNKIRSDNRPENLELWTTSHPPGARIEDLCEWAEWLLATYKPTLQRLIGA